MCGIFGTVRLDGRPVEPATLDAMGAVTVHRGPDDAGARIDGNVGIGMRRLSIIDLASGHQPIGNETGTVWCVCNGEIYNFRELRADLEKRGHRFSTRSDSEVLVHLYEEYGERCVDRLDGMYGFAVWDLQNRILLVGRDRLGIKPLYVLQTGNEILFASEAKAIIATRDTAPQICENALDEYLALGYVPAPFSLFRGVGKLPPATYLKVEMSTGKVTRHRYWRPQSSVDVSRDDHQWAERLLETLERSVSSQMVSDVPLGAFLSGGIDSSSVVAMMARHSTERIKTYSIGFSSNESAGAYYDETDFARRVAEQFDTEHSEIRVDPDAASLLPKLLWHLDEPVADSAFITTHLVAELARTGVKAILSGVGGDELFGGYRRYLGDRYSRWLNLVPEPMRRGVLAPIAKRLPSDRHSPILNRVRLAKAFLLSHDLSPVERYRRYVGVFDEHARTGLVLSEPKSRFDALGKAFDSIDGTNVNALMEADLLTQLPDDLLLLTDKMTMANSLECRVPLLDQALVDLALVMPAEQKIRNGTLKYVLKNALGGVLPETILHRPKRGFGAPMGAWLKTSLAEMIDNLLSEESVEARGLFDPTTVQDLIAAHRSNAEDYTDHLLALANLEIWSRIFLDGRPHEDVSAELEEAC